MKSEPKILCIVPSLPNELRLDTLRSIAYQTVPVSAICVLTKNAPNTLPFPAKISYVMNEWLNSVIVEDFDYVLRVDADTVLPHNFVEGNIQGGFSNVGYGPAQLIRVKDFVDLMGGRFNSEHDDGYPIAKFKLHGLKAQSTYFVEPKIMRQPGVHQGTGWFIAQGVLHYKYGYDILVEFAVVFGKWKQHRHYGLFYLAGYFKALFTCAKRFDVGEVLLYRNLEKYRHPSRFFRVFKVSKYRNKILGLVKHE